MANDLTIILCIPGQWKDRSEIVTSLAEANFQEYIFAGNVLLHLPTNESFEVEVCKPDTRLKISFEVAGQGRLDPSELDRIDKHSFVIYIIGKGGDIENAEKIMKAGQSFLNAGGLGIKVETTGKAFNKEQWTALTKFDHEQKYYEAFVVLLSNEDGSIHSCGMHNLGLHDTSCNLELNLQETADLIETFSIYQLVDKPKIISGQTFSASVDSPVFRIMEEGSKYYDKEDLFHNPFGMYYLHSK